MNRYTLHRQAPRFFSHSRSPYSLLLCLLACILASSPSPAAVQEDNQGWLLLTVQGPLSGKTRFYLEAQPRVGENISRTYQVLLRAAVGQQITKNISLWQGYGWTPTLRPRFRNETRLYQQLQYNDRVAGWDMVERFRFEERLIEDANDVAFRARDHVRMWHSISPDKLWYFVGYDELFLNLNSVPSARIQSGFDQNHSFVGIGRRLSQSTRLESGYLLEYIHRASRAPDQLNHVFLTAIRINFK